MPHFEYINAKILKIDGDSVATKKFVEDMISRYIPVGGFPCHNGKVSFTPEGNLSFSKLPPGIKIGVDPKFLNTAANFHHNGIKGHSCIAGKSPISIFNYKLSSKEPCPLIHPIWFHRIEKRKRPTP